MIFTMNTDNIGKIVRSILTILFIFCSTSSFAIIEDGVFKEFFDTGEVKRIVTYKDSKLNGYFNSFYKSGKLKGEGLYVDDHLEEKARGYYPNGVLELEVNYKKGKLHGPSKSFYEDTRCEALSD